MGVATGVAARIQTAGLHDRHGIQRRTKKESPVALVGKGD